jgi:large subunit ribosomal protein L29
MAIMRLSEIKDLDVKQIDEKTDELRTELGKMKSQVRSGGAPENGGKAKEIRRTIARLLTIKSQKANESPKAKK